MVEGHFREQVVAHVCVGDVVECVVEDRTERSVDGAEGAWMMRRRGGLGK